MKQFFNNIFVGNKDESTDLPNNSFMLCEDTGEVITKINDKDIHIGKIAPFISSTTSKIPTNSNDFEFKVEGGNFDYNTKFTFNGSSVTIVSINIISNTEAIIIVNSDATVGDVEFFAENGNTKSKPLMLIPVEDVVVMIPSDDASNPYKWVRKSSNITTSVGEILPNSSTTGWNKGASFGTVPANRDFSFTFNLKVNQANQYGNLMIGVDNSDPDFAYNSIDHCIYISGSNGGSISIRENGSSKGSFGSCNFTDKLGIKRVGTVITYLKNDVVLYTSSVNSTSQMVFDMSSYRRYGATNIRIEY